MESVEAKVTKVVINTTCIGVEEKYTVLNTRLEVVDGEKKIMETRKPLGWFALFAGSWEWIHVGLEPPPFKKNDPIRITIETSSREFA